MHYKVVCVNCSQEVSVHMVRYGEGYVAVCPLCNRLAYNSTKLPEGDKP